MATDAAHASVAVRLRMWAGAQSGWRRHALAFLAGSVSVLAFAPFFFSPVLFLTLPILVWLIDTADASRAAAKSGWWFGFGFFISGLFWIGEAFLVEADKFAWMLPFAVTLLPAGLALFWAAAAALSRRLWPHGFDRVLVLAIFFSLAEYLRGTILTGLPWNILGYALTYPDALMQSAGLFGIYGLSLLAITLFAGPLVIAADNAATSRTQLQSTALVLIPLAVLWGYGAWRLSAPQLFADGVKIRVVQPNVLQSEKWRPEFQRQIFDTHLALSKSKPDGTQDNLDGITHVIWPEAAMPFLPLETPQALAAIGDLLPAGTTLISGALRRSAPALDKTGAAALTAAAYNSILVFDDTGALSSGYDKIHLVPFGEYIPFEPMLSTIGLSSLTFGRAPFTPGAEPRRALAVRGLPPVLAIVCYEALFPDELAPPDGQAGVIINVTNDGWFGNSTGPRQHFHQTRVRAVEQGLPVFRAANNGISGVIDGYGRVLASVGINERGVIDSRLPIAVAAPPFAHLGEKIFLLMLLAWAGVCFVPRRNHVR